MASKPPPTARIDPQTLQPVPQGSTAVAMRIGDDLKLLEPEIAKVIPEHITVDRFMRVVATAIAMNPDVRDADRRSLFTAAVKAATDGLVPDGREGAFVVYGKQVVWMPMVAGIIKKVRNSGELQSITSNVVHVADFFDYWIDDTGEHIMHRPKLDGERGDISCAYAVAKTLKGGVYTEVMSRGQVDQVRKASKAPNGPAWRDWYGEMARKAVVRRLAKRLPMSTDLEQVILRDDDHFELERAKRAEAANSGTGGLRKALGIDPPAGNGQSETEPTHYDDDSARAAIAECEDIDALEELRKAILADYESTQRSLPVEVDAAINDRMNTLEQEAGA